MSAIGAILVNSLSVVALLGLILAVADDRHASNGSLMRNGSMRRHACRAGRSC